MMSAGWQMHSGNGKWSTSNLLLSLFLYDCEYVWINWYRDKYVKYV